MPRQREKRLRSAPIRRQALTRATPITFREKILRRGVQQQDKQQFIENLQNTAKSVINSISNIKNISFEAKKYFDRNAPNLPLTYRGVFFNFLKQEADSLRNRQQGLINKYKQDAIRYEKRARRYDDKNNRAKEDEYDARSRAAQDIAQRLERGERLDTGSANKFIKREGNIAEQTILQKQARTKAVKRFGEQEFAVNRYIRGQLQRNKIPSIADLRKRFNIPLKDAASINRSLNKNVMKQFGDKFYVEDPVLKQTRPATPDELLNITLNKVQKDLGVSRLEARKINQEVLEVNKKTGKPFGRLSKAPEAKTWDDKLEKYRQQIIYDRDKAQYGNVRPLQIIGSQLLLGGVGIIRGLNSVKDTILNPKRFIQTQIQAIRQPVKTVRILANEFTIDPVGTIAQYWVFAKTLNLGTKAVKRSPVGRYVQEQLFIRAQPKEIRPYVKTIIKSAKVQEKLYPIKIKSIKKVDFTEVKSLTRPEAKALAATLKNTDSVVFGSVAGKALSRKQTPLPKDVDIATANIQTFSRKFINSLPKKIQKNYKIRGQKLIRKTNNEALFDIKPLYRLYPDKSLFTKKGYLPVSGYVYDIGGKLTKKLGIRQKIPAKIRAGTIEVPTQKIVKVEGIKLVSFGEQTTRKALGTLQVLLEKNVRRAKDPQAFVRSLEIQLSALKAKPKPGLITKSRIKSLSNAIKILKSKSFAKALEKKVPSLVKEYPILKKLNIKRLKKPRKLTATEKIKWKAREIEAVAKVNLKKAKSMASRLPKVVKSKLPSYLPKKLRSSLLPSKIPSRLPSKIPSRVPSRVPSRPPSRIPSKVPSKPPSKIPSKIPSRVPSKVPSKPPSKVPSRPPSIIPSRIPSKPPSIIPALPPKVPPAKPPILIKKLKWKKKLPRGLSYAVNGIVRVKGKSRVIRLKTTPNRALKYMGGLVDNTTARSFQLMIIGVTRTKDIKKPNILKKFRPKIQSSKVLNIVEKTKHAIDTRGEKRGLKISKLLRRRKNVARKPKRNVRNVQRKPKSKKRKRKKGKKK